MSGSGHLAAAEIARRELRLFLSMAEQNGMDADGQRRWLLVSQDDWQSWLGILQDEPLPPRPALPLLLRRLGSLTSRMDRLPNAGRGVCHSPGRAMACTVDPAVPLPPERLYRPADLAALSFETTQELAPPRELADQPRAHEAIRFGTEMAVRGFNIFAIGAIGAHIQGSVRALLEDAAGKRPKPSDWVYVNNFATPHRPVAIALPPGRAPALDKALDDLIDDLKVSLPAAFESEDYQKRRSGIEQEIRGKQRARLHRAARQGDGQGHRDPAHADGLRDGADEGRPGGAARRVQCLARRAAASGAGGDRGTGKGSGGDAARSAAPRARAARRGAQARSRNRTLRHRAADRGLQAQFADLPKVAAAPRRDPGRHPGERRAVHQSAGDGRGSRARRHAARQPVRSLRGQRAGHPRGRTRPAPRWSRKCIRR